PPPPGLLDQPVAPPPQSTDPLGQPVQDPAQPPPTMFSQDFYKSVGASELLPPSVIDAELAPLGLNEYQITKVINANQNIINHTREAFIEQARKDPEIGGSRFETTIKHAKVAYDKYASPALQEVLQGTGLSSHPEVIRMFANLGKAVSEDTGIPAQALTSGAGVDLKDESTQLNVLYGNN
uniref:hypothetical protein n=1 Tax=Thiolapillus sp. TaxID=2017437 RepID=UPI003AF7C46C